MGIIQSLCAHKTLTKSRSSISSLQLEVTPESIQRMKEQSEIVRKLFGFDAAKLEITVNDIWPIKLLGRGSFGKVYLVKINDNYFAMKQVKKKLILQKQHLENLLYERFIMQKFEHPFLVKVYFAFQDALYINLVMEFVPGGELFYHLQKRKKFDQKATVFFSAQILLALQFLHEKVGVIYRDLKPENVLIEKDGYIKLTDLGLAKQNTQLCYSFCGTDEYLAPEIIEEKGHDSNVDLWTFGCIIYEMLFGQPPFHDDSKKILFNKIQNLNYTFPKNISPEAQDLITKLLQYNPSDRISFKEMKVHAFFEEMNFEELLEKKIKPPFEPLILTQTDTRNFDQVLESQMKQSGKFNQEEDDLFQDFPFLAKNAFL